jgi:hypothetical protein
VTFHADSDARRWRDTVRRVRDLFPGHRVDVWPATDGAIGEVHIDGRSATVHERLGIVRALDDVHFAQGFPSLRLTMRGEVAAGYEDAKCGTVLRASSQGRRVRWVAINPCGPLLALPARGGE